MKMPIHDMPTRQRVIADTNLRERLRWETRNIWKMIASVNQQAGHSTTHFMLNEVAVFRRRGSMCRPGPSRLSYFRIAKALLRISRSPRFQADHH
jgi:hypothetical protein